MPSAHPLIVDCADLSHILSNPPLLTSYQSGWSGIQLAHHRQTAIDLPEIANPQHIVIIPVGHRSVEAEFLTEGHLHTFSFQEPDYASCIEFFPAELPYKIYATTESNLFEFIHCYLEPSFVAQIAPESVNPDRVELLLELKRPDLLIRQIGLALRQSLALDGIGSHFYADSMATALSAHLLRYYATRTHSFRTYEDGLSRHNLEQALEYIDVHLGENLSLSTIANELNMSQYYFCRLFKRSMGITPHQYLIQQRVERAKQLLKRSELTITAVALHCGFSGQSHLAKHFRKQTGLTPQQFRQL
ncbi:MAG: AraC family transcriptional regulator [Leptolyngbyaceae cyanobacterium bins.302]|nr:AraC family transcriptional regulator [Leptolyngbyaceae cyanobacterium bins.302]